MNWKVWKVGLAVSGLMGFCMALVAVGAIGVEKVTWKAFAVVVAVNVGGCFLNYLKEHPVDKITWLLAGGLLLTGTGCFASRSAVNLAKALAKDPAAVSVDVKVGTPWGVQEVRMRRVGALTNVVELGAEGLKVNAGK